MNVPVPFPLSQVRPEDTAIEIKCVVVKPVMRYLESLQGKEALMRTISETRMNPLYLENSSNWVSFDYLCRLLDKLVEVTGDPMAPYKAARAHTDNRSYGFLAPFFTRFASPSTVYRMVGQFYSLWNRISAWHISDMTENSCVVTVRFARHKPVKNNCLAIQGSLAAGPGFFDLPHAAVKELRCACEGGNACVYQVQWTNKPTMVRACIGALVGLAMAIPAAYCFGWSTAFIFVVVAMAVTAGMAGRGLDYKARLAEVYRKTEEQASSLLESIRATEALKEELQRQVEQRTAELSEANQQLERTIRDLKESQAKVILAERQAAVGVLAAGMAHEINNPMNAIRLSLQALREGLSANSEMTGVVETATRATARCSRIVSDMLSFAREPQQVSQVALREILAETLADFRKEHPGEFQIVTQFSQSVVPLRLDRAQIKQAVTNILSNAYDAMEGCGQVDVALGGNAEEVVLTIKDHGPGIEEALLPRVFDPFFTTKKSVKRKGTGLGLSIAYQLVQRNGGVIEVQSEKGRGATFSLRFPVNASARQPGSGADSP